MISELWHLLSSGAHWAISLITLGCVALTVVFHYEVLSRLNRWLPRVGMRRRRGMLVLMGSLFAAHAVEIWIFGLAIYVTEHFPALGQVEGVVSVLLYDSLYLSAVTYTTVGYGDLAPFGPLRLLLATEALVGFMMITWSASFTYLEMERYWRPRP